MTNEKRLEVELDIVRRYVRALLDAGYDLAVHDGEEITVPYCCDEAKIISALRTTDEDTLLARNEGHIGWLFFVYGNEPGEVLNDYTVGLESTIEPVNEYAESFA